MVTAILLRASLLVLGMVELALEMDGVERHAVAGGRDLGIDDIGAGAGAGAGDHGEQARDGSARAA